MVLFKFSVFVQLLHNTENADKIDRTFYLYFYIVAHNLEISINAIKLHYFSCYYSIC